jgi:hypothetical protein
MKLVATGPKGSWAEHSGTFLYRLRQNPELLKGQEKSIRRTR